MLVRRVRVHDGRNHADDGRRASLIHHDFGGAFDDFGADHDRGADHDDYDIFVDLEPGSTGVIEFVADIPGIFELELESSGVLLADLEVAP